MIPFHVGSSTIVPQCLLNVRLGAKRASVCSGLPGATQFEALGFPTVSFQRCCRPTWAGLRPEAANHRAAAGLSDSAVGPSTSQCALTSQRGGKEDLTLKAFLEDVIVK